MSTDLIVSIEHFQDFLDKNGLSVPPEFTLLKESHFDNCPRLMASDALIQLPKQRPDGQPGMVEAGYRAKLFFARFGCLPTACHDLIHGDDDDATTSARSLEVENWPEWIQDWDTRAKFKMRGANTFIQLFVDFTVRWEQAQLMLDMAHLNVCLLRLPINGTPTPEDDQDEVVAARAVELKNWEGLYRDMKSCMQECIHTRINDLSVELGTALERKKKKLSGPTIKIKKAEIAFIKTLATEEPRSRYNDQVFNSPEDIHRLPLDSYFGNSLDERKAFWFAQWEQSPGVYFSFLEPIRDVIDVK